MSVPTSPGPSILLVDDDPEIRSMVGALLSKRGYAVRTSGDGQSALEEIARARPDLVVLDVMMPRMNGWEVARVLRQNDATRGTKILMLTAIGEHVNELTSPLYGVDAYLDKPFEFATLAETIASLVGPASSV